MVVMEEEEDEVIKHYIQLIMTFQKQTRICHHILGA
jgi:hypothetical protein